MPPRKKLAKRAVVKPLLIRKPLRAWFPPGPAWASATLLALWTAWFVWSFERLALKDAANLDGGVIFAMVTFTFGYLFAAAGLFTRGVSRVSPILVALSGLVPLLFLKGAQTSAGEIFTLQSMPWYVGANLVWAFLGVAQGPADVDDESPSASRLVALILLPLALGAFIIWLRSYTFAHLSVPAERNSLHHLYVPRASSSNDIVGKDFDRWLSLSLSLVLAAVFGACLVFWGRIKNLPQRTILLSLLALAFLSKFCIAALSSQGLAIVGEKISSLNTNYYTLVSIVEDRGAWGYIRDYGSLQLGQGAHGDTHPPGAVLLYWALTRVLGKHPMLVGMAIGFLSSLAVPLLYLVARRHYASVSAGLVVALIYISTPVSLILSSAGIDSIVAMLIILALAGLSQAHDQRPILWGVITGLLFFVASMFSFSASIALMIAGLWSLDTLLRRHGKLGVLGTLWIWVPLLLTLVASHGILWGLFGGKFSYMKAVNDASFIHRSMNQYRTYELWSWANVLLYAGYAGVGLLAANLMRVFTSLWRGNGTDGLLNASTPFVLTLIFACMGRSEVQREFLIGTFFLVLPVAPLFLAGERLRTAALALVLGWNLLNTVALEILILDYW